MLMLPVVIFLAGVIAAEPVATSPSADTLCVINGEAVRLSDFENALFLDNHELVARDVLPVLIQELVIRQAASAKGVSVKKDEIDSYMADLDRQFRGSEGIPIAEYLRRQGTDEAFFRRKLETTLGLFLLAGGKGRPSQAMADPAVRARMEQTIAKLLPSAKVELDPARLPADAAATVNGEKLPIAEAGRVARFTLSEEARKRTFAGLKRFVLARQEMERRGLRLTEDDLDYQFKLASQARATRIGEQEFELEKVLEQMGRDVKLLRRQYGFRAVAMLTRLVRAEVTDREVEERFRSRPAEFGDGASKIGHILIRTSDSRGQPLPPAQVRKARDDAEDVHRRLSRGEDFAQLAIALSQDSATAANGGLLGWGDALPNLPEEVRLAAAGLEPGQISRPVRSGQGWHVVKVTERRRVSWEEARPGVLSKIVNERRRKLLGELEKAARIEPGPAGL